MFFNEFIMSKIFSVNYNFLFYIKLSNKKCNASRKYQICKSPVPFNFSEINLQFSFYFFRQYHSSSYIIR